MIKTRSLRVDYEGVTAVLDLNLDILEGQIYGLVGPNGAGKTSTLKTIAGIIEPTYGDIHIGPYDLELNPREALRQLGFMPDFPPVYENLKVREYLEVFAAAYFCERENRLKLARHWVERVKLEDKWDAFIHTLSRGMRQRLVLAKTLLHDPKVVLLDEPASGLDPMARIEMRAILKEIAAAGKTIVISSHILTELSDFCNAIGVMEKGRMVVSGTVEEIRARVGMTNELIIETPDTADATRARLRDALNACALLAAVREPKPGEFRAAFSGDKAAASSLLSQIIRDGIPVSEFLVKEANVEDIFFKIGARETS